MEIDVSSGESKLRAPPGEDDSCLKVDDATAPSEDVEMEDVWKKPSEDPNPDCLQDVSPSLSFSEQRSATFIEVFSRYRKPFDEAAATAGGTKYDDNLIYRLLRTEEKNYLSAYCFDYFHNMRRQERASMLEGILDGHPEISKFLRAHLVNWLMHVCEVLSKEDTTLPFVAVSMMDRFYKLTKTAEPAKDVQLTGLTGLFIASKYFEITPIFLDQLIKEMCY